MNYEENLKTAHILAEKISEKGGRAYYVGGFVRDRLQGMENKDLDIEVHGITPDVLEEILASIGGYIPAGKSFGVYKLAHHSIDVAMPRKETLTGKGHRDFKIDVDPFIGTKKAAVRRDFTVNALMQDVLTEEIIDHFGGREDLKNGILRHINDTAFGEDPLRVFRGAQFAARFNFTVACETMKLCKKIDLSTLSSERVFDELKKALLKSDKPSLFFENLRKMNHLSYWFSETEKLIGIPQHSVHHKEGDVWTHTMMVLDECARMRDKADYPLYLMLSALVHDYGKIVATEFIKGDYHAYRHEILGDDIIKTFIKRITNENALSRYVLNMTHLHMKPHMLAADKSSVKATNKMFDESVSPNDLILLSLCDGLGKIPQKSSEDAELFLRTRLEIYSEYMSRPYVTGKDLIDAGIKQGEEFTKLLDFAHKLRLSGVNKEETLKQVLKNR